MRYEGGQPLPEKRLHPLSWVFQLVGSLGAVIPIGVAVALGAERGGLFWVVVPLLLLGPLGALWHQWVYRYDFADDGLVIRDGLIFRNLRQIDYRRIENIDTQRNLLHRLLGVADVKVETSSGGGAEATIRVLSLDDARTLSDTVFARRDALKGATSTDDHGAGEPAEGTTLLTLPPGLWWLGVHGLWLPLAGVPLALIHGHLYAKYTRWALTPDLLLFHRGWLWRRLAVVPRNRIQAIRLTRSPFDRRYRMSELEVDTAGGGLGKRRVRLPYLDRRVAARLGSALYH